MEKVRSYTPTHNYSYDAFLTSKIILLTPCFLGLYCGPNCSIRPHFAHITPPAPTWHGKVKSHLTETQFYMLWVWKSPKSRCSSEKKCYKIFEAPFSKIYRHANLKKKIPVIEAKLTSSTRSPFRIFGRPKKNIFNVVM